MVLKNSGGYKMSMFDKLLANLKAKKKTIVLTEKCQN